MARILAKYALFALILRLIIKNIWPFRAIFFSKQVLSRRSRITSSLQNCTEFDYIIIGAGSAGCVIANRLSEDPTVSVLLVEAGGNGAKDARVNIPALFPMTQNQKNLDWSYRTVADDGATRGRVHYWPRGKVLGGCSATNAMLYVRGNKEDFNEWESKHGCKGWNYNRILPYFLKSEGAEIEPSRLDRGYHSNSGPLINTLCFGNEPLALSKMYIQAADAIGLGKGPNGMTEPPKSKSIHQQSQFPTEYGIDYNGSVQFGSGIIQSNASKGQRCSTSRAFLEKITDPKLSTYRENLTVLTEHTALQLQFGTTEQGQHIATGVLVGRPTTKETIFLKARKEVIVSCGTIGTPKLLLNSGIGNRRDLEILGVPVVQDLPAVGQHMQDHLFLPLGFHDKSRSVYRKSIGSTIKGVYEYVTERKGILTTVGLEVTSFFNTPSCTVAKTMPNGYPNAQIHFIPGMVPPEFIDNMLIQTAVLGPIDPAYYQAFNSTESRMYFDKTRTVGANDYVMSIMPTLLHPKSKGSVKLFSKDPYAAPVITPNYLQKDEDVTVFAEALEIARMVGEKMQKLFPDVVGAERIDYGIVKELERVWEMKGLKGRQAGLEKSREYNREFARRYGMTVYHPVGTCRMGPKGVNTVVSHLDLKVHGFVNLRVADASVMPEITSGNTNAPTIMIGEVCADMIKGVFSI